MSLRAVGVLVAALLVKGLGLPALALAQDASALSDPTVDESASRAEASGAGLHIERGEALYDGENYEGAIAEFERAYELLASHPLRYQVLYNLALCHERLGRYASALDYYMRYLREAGPGAENRAAVQASMRTLEGLLGTLVLHIRFEKNQPSVAPEVWIDQRLAGESTGTYLLPSGRHTIEVRAQGYESALREVQLTARASSVLDVELEAKSEGLRPALFWTGVGLTAAGGIASGVLAARAVAKSNEVEDKPVAARTDADQHAVRKAALATDVTLGATGAFAVGTLILYFLTDFDSSEGKPAPRGRISWLPEADVGVAWTGVWQ